MNQTIPSLMLVQSALRAMHDAGAAFYAAQQRAREQGSSWQGIRASEVHGRCTFPQPHRYHKEGLL
jgi:pyruvate/2-oxoglutarate dehydrogenase complex dihydrolipoamide acyltransferase (E2) component